MILAIDHKNWNLDIEYFASVLLNLFGEVRITKINDIDRPYAYSWESSPANVHGFIHKKLNSIHFNGEFENIARIVFELTSSLPTEGKSYFFDESYTLHMEVNKVSKLADIQNIVKAAQ